MTVLSADALLVDSARFDHLPAELADGITNTVIRPRDPEARSAAVCSLVREIYESIEWLHGFDTEHDELASLAMLITAARDHQTRMAATQPARTEPT